MSDHDTNSRLNRHEKRKKNKQKLLILISLGVVFCIILFSLIAFGGKEDPSEPELSQAEKALKNKEEAGDRVSNQSEEIEIADEKRQSEEESEEESDVDIKEEESDDDNVIKAYSGDWQPVGTSQSGPHTTNYNDGSDDRKEIKEAVSIVTGINNDDIVELWVGNGGDQKVEATVSDQAGENYFKVYLTWIDDDGWQVKRVERLKEYQ